MNGFCQYYLADEFARKKLFHIEKRKGPERIENGYCVCKINKLCKVVLELILCYKDYSQFKF